MPPITNARKSGEQEKQVFRLHSTPLINTPGIINYLLNASRTGDKLVALDAMASGFPTLPVGLVMDLLDGRLEYRVEHETVVIEWETPR